MPNYARSTRLNAYHSPKRILLGGQASQVAPAWRDQKPMQDLGSKILLSSIPSDVGETEIEELFTKTVGPLKGVFLIYNLQARSRGMAIVSFQRSKDAAIARAKYNGKFIDGKRAIKIEIIVDSDGIIPSSVAQAPPSLLNRLGAVAAATPKHTAASLETPVSNHTQSNIQTQELAKSIAPRVAYARKIPNAPRWRQRKGPRLARKSLAQLDHEMEEYKARGETLSVDV